MDQFASLILKHLLGEYVDGTVSLFHNLLYTSTDLIHKAWTPKT